MPLEDGTKVFGLDENGCVVIEDSEGMQSLTNELPEEFLDWYGLEDMDTDELAALGIRLH